MTVGLGNIPAVVCICGKLPGEQFSSPSSLLRRRVVGLCTSPKLFPLPKQRPCAAEVSSWVPRLLPPSGPGAWDGHLMASV